MTHYYAKINNAGEVIGTQTTFPRAYKDPPENLIEILLETEEERREVAIGWRYKDGRWIAPDHPVEPFPNPLSFPRG